MTTEQQKAHELIEKFNDLMPMESSLNDTAEDAISKMNNDFNASKQCAIICVDEVILSNPHSNPFNTELNSTMEFWQTVRQEIINYNQ